MINQTNTSQGRNNKELLKNSLPDHPQAFAIAKQIAGIADSAMLQDSNVIVQTTRKVNVEFLFAGYNKPLTFNVKSFKDAGYNHLERRKLNQFCSLNEIQRDDESLLRRMILAKAAGGRACPFVPHNNREQVTRIFSHIDVGSGALLGNDRPNALALYSVHDRTFKIYDMSKHVIPRIKGQPISFTNTGSNIQIGKYIVIQRKGKESLDIGDSMTDINHPANNIQIKMLVKKFYLEVNPACWYRL